MILRGQSLQSLEMIESSRELTFEVFSIQEVVSFLKRESPLNRLLKCLKSFDWFFEMTANSASFTIP